MGPTEHLQFILPIFFVASFVRSSFGFGSALLAMPLLLLFLPTKTATPLLTTVELSIGVFILMAHWRKIAIKQLSQLLMAALLGIPLGIIFLKFSNDHLIRLILAITILLFVLLNSIIKNKSFSNHKALPWGAGILSGFLGGVGNIGGPPLVLFASLKGWNPNIFMATLQGHFFITGIFIFIGHGIGGLWNKNLFITWILSLPVIFLGNILGNKLHSTLPQEKFYIIINGLLIFLSLFILIQSIGVIL